MDSSYSYPSGNQTTGSPIVKTKDGKRDEWHEATVVPAVQALQEERKMLSQRKQTNKVELSMKLSHDREEME